MTPTILPSTTHRRPLGITVMCLSLLTASTLALTGCTGAGDAGEPEASENTSSGEAADTQAGFPRTIEVPAPRGGKPTTLDIPEEPSRIAALDYESAETIAALGLADRLVLVPEAVTNPALGGHVDEMAEVETTIPVAMELSAETVIGVSPDLVVMSPRHGAENSIGTVMTQAGITTLMLPDSWTSTSNLTANIDLIGQATGADAPADELQQELQEGLTPGEDGGGDDAAESPRVLVLTNQAGRPFVTAGHAFPLELLSLAGATNISDDLGIDITGPISAEQVIEADPDGILLIDMNGSGDRIFADLLANPAVAGLTGAEHTLLVNGGDVQALGLTRTVQGLEELREWVATLR